ncbi:nitrate reductase [Anseongella ginsenosidimutans]|nr:nitrate reductase [Anseongella ginsenosidimutans]
MKRAAAVFKSLTGKYGPDSVGFYLSGQCLTEEYYLANKLVKGFIGTNNIDTNSRLCMSSAVAAYTQTLGEDTVPVAYEDLEKADCFLVAGANPAWCHPILFRRLENHRQQHPEVRLIVVDPRKTQTCSQADLHLQLIPGTDVYLYHAIARVLIEEGNIDIDFITQHCENFEQYRRPVFEYTVSEAASTCGIEESDIRLAASWIGNAAGFISMWAMGLNQSVIGVNKNLALISLHLLTGKIGRAGSGPLSLTGQPNAMGGREVGGMATLLPAHRRLDNPLHRQEVAAFWKVPAVPERPGLAATKLFEALESGEVKAVWIMCTNPLVSLPNANQVEAALKKARFVVVQDISGQNQAIPYADLVLPAAGHFEKEGTMTNSERRITYLSKVTAPPGEALPDAEILLRFARAMGFKGFGQKNMAEVFAEHAALTRHTNIDISGLSYKRLQEEGSMQWPVPHPQHTGTSRLFENARFFTESGKARFQPVQPLNLSEQTSPSLPLILTTGRIRDQWHTMTKTGKVNKLKQHISKPFAEIHPDDAAARDIREGDVVVVENTRGQVRTRAVLTAAIRKGVVFMPMHWGKLLGQNFSRTNNLTSSLTDPVSKEPDYKFSAVQVKKYVKPRERLIVVGAGAAAYRFINTYRELNREDEIFVFSREKYPFYNRVLLPEYVSDHLAWENLLKFKKGEFEKLDVQLYTENKVVSINRERKTVTDQLGETHSYDKLVLATGSSAFVPRDVPLHLPGVFSMRSRENADQLKTRLHKDAHVLIVGGGLLGLELAASLRETGIQVSIVQLSGRLMERQLDSLASGMLQDFVEEKWIRVFTHDQVQSIEPVAGGAPDSGGPGGLLTARLKSGRKLACDAIVFAIGTRPNMELATACGLETGRGIMVNDYLQTSDPDILAMGEIAEHRGKLNGITAAAEQQADIAARYLNGDLLSYYEGTLSMNILKFSDFDLCSLGIPEIPSGGEGYEEILFIDKSQRYYKKCIIKDDRLEGAILMGDKSEFAEFKSLIESKLELSEKRKELLRSGKAAAPVKGKLVCSCNNVGRGNLEELISGGCENFAELCRVSGAGLGCGSCKPEVKEILADCTASGVLT